MRFDLNEQDHLDHWEALISTVDKTDIPIQFVRLINIVFHAPVKDEDEQDINIQELRNDGWDEDGLDLIVAEVLKEHDKNIKSIHFYLDVEHVADVVQQHTKIFLKGIQ